MVVAKTQSQCSDLSQQISLKIASFFFLASDNESLQPEDQTCLVFLADSFLFVTCLLAMRHVFLCEFVVQNNLTV